MKFEFILEKALKEELEFNEALQLLKESYEPAKAIKLFETANYVRKEEFGDKIYFTAGIRGVLKCQLKEFCRYCNVSFRTKPFPIQQIPKAVEYINESGAVSLHLSGGTKLSGYDDEILEITRIVYNSHNTIPLEINLGPSIQKDETLIELRKLGVESITCSLETYNEEIFNKVKPADSLDAIKDLLKRSDSLGFKLKGMLLVGLGETNKDRIEHIFYLKKFKNFVNLRFSRFYPFPNTKMAHMQRTSPWEVARLIAVTRLSSRRWIINSAAGNTIDDLPLYYMAGASNQTLGICAHVKESNLNHFIPKFGTKIIELDENTVIEDQRILKSQYLSQMGYKLGLI